MTGASGEAATTPVRATSMALPLRLVREDRLGWLAVTAVAVVASVGVVPWLGKSIYRDEGASLYSARLSWSALWAQSRHVDLVLLPYYALLHFWIAMSGSIEWARVPSLLAYGGTVFVAGGLGLRAVGRWCGIVAAFLTAANPILITEALDARPYALCALGSTLCAVALVKWMHGGEARWLWVFGSLAVAVTVIHLFAVLAPVSMLVAVLAARPHLVVRRLRSILAPIGTFAIVACACAAASVGQLGQVRWIGGLSAGGYLFGEAEGPAGGGGDKLYPAILVVAGVAVLCWLVTTWDRGGRRAVVDLFRGDRDLLALCLGWAALPTVALSIVSLAHRVFQPRYVISSAAGLALSVALLCARLVPVAGEMGQRRTGQPAKRRLRQWLALLGTGATAILVVGYLSKASVVGENLEGVASYVARHAQPGDRTALVDHSLTTGVDYYLTRDHRLVATWPQLGTRQPYVEGFDLVLDRAAIAHAAPRLWLVDDGSVTGVPHFQSILLSQHYVLVENWQFTGVSLLLYRRLSG